MSDILLCQSLIRNKKYVENFQHNREFLVANFTSFYSFLRTWKYFTLFRSLFSTEFSFVRLKSSLALQKPLETIKSTFILRSHTGVAMDFFSRLLQLFTSISIRIHNKMLSTACGTKKNLKKANNPNKLRKNQIDWLLFTVFSSERNIRWKMISTADYDDVLDDRFILIYTNFCTHNIEIKNKINKFIIAAERLNFISVTVCVDVWAVIISK